MADERYYRPDLALAHHLGFGFHADACAPGILARLEPVRARNGLVLEFGCGSGLLTRFLVDAGHRVVATDASPAMLDLTRQTVPDAEAIETLLLPDDPVPEADAIVGIGHPLNYLPDEAAIDRALAALAGALRPGGIVAFDLCDLEWASARAGVANQGRVGDDWAVISQFAIPAPNRFVREITTFLRNDDGTWRRDDEHHDNVLLDVSRVPAVLAAHGIAAEVRDSFGDEVLPVGLKAIIGHKTE
jgi:SAM-dependent methyltransferase